MTERDNQPQVGTCPDCGTDIKRLPGEHWVLLDGGKRVCTNPWHSPLRQGHSALRWNKDAQAIETFDPHPTTGPRPLNKQVPELTISDECKYCAEGEPEWSPYAKCWIHRRESLDKRCTRKGIELVDAHVECGQLRGTSFGLLFGRMFGWLVALVAYFRRALKPSHEPSCDFAAPVDPRSRACDSSTCSDSASAWRAEKASQTKTAIVLIAVAALLCPIVVRARLDRPLPFLGYRLGRFAQRESRKQTKFGEVRQGEFISIPKGSYYGNRSLALSKETEVDSGTYRRLFIRLARKSLTGHYGIPVGSGFLRIFNFNLGSDWFAGGLPCHVGIQRWSFPEIAKVQFDAHRLTSRNINIQFLFSEPRTLLQAEVLGSFVEPLPRNFGLSASKIGAIAQLLPLTIRDDRISNYCDDANEFRCAFQYSPNFFYATALGFCLYAYGYMGLKVGYGNPLVNIGLFLIGLPLCAYGLFEVFETIRQISKVIM